MYFRPSKRREWWQSQQKHAQDLVSWRSCLFWQQASDCQSLLALSNVCIALVYAAHRVCNDTIRPDQFAAASRLHRIQRCADAFVYYKRMPCRHLHGLRQNLTCETSSRSSQGAPSHMPSRLYIDHMDANQHIQPNLGSSVPCIRDQICCDTITSN